MNNWWANYIGVPFGDGPGEMDCWRLVRRVYQEQLGISLPVYGEINANDLIRVARAMSSGEIADGWVPCCPEEFAVVGMRTTRGGSRVTHVGVVVGDDRVLHTEQATGAAVVPLTHISVAGRIMGYWRKQKD